MADERKLIEDMRAAVSSAIHKCLGVWPDIATCDVVIADLSAVAFPAIRERCAAVVENGKGWKGAWDRTPGLTLTESIATAIRALSLDAPPAGGEENTHD